MSNARFRLRGCVALATLLGSAIAGASPHEFTAQVDLRAVLVDSPLTSFTDGGLGLLRFDEAHDGVQLGAVMLDAAGPLTETVRYTVTAYATDDNDKNPVDLTEAFLDWRPYPDSSWRWRTRAGAFYAPVSLENRAIGWQSLYTLSPSAINTWIGEEFRTIGTEVSATLLGAQSGRSFDFSLVASVYGWNDPAGVLILQRGWAIHDRQTALFGKLPRPLVWDPNNRTLEFFAEIDDRIGYYAGVEAKWSDDNVVRVLHYDNRGDIKDSIPKEPAWLTVFDSAGIRLQLPASLTFITQGMTGYTEAKVASDGRAMFAVDFWSWFGLLSHVAGPHRVTIRYDRMYTELTRGQHALSSKQNARAWTAAYLYDLNEHWQLAAEGLRNQGSLAQRALVGAPVNATEDSLQVAVRYTF